MSTIELHSSSCDVESCGAPDHVGNQASHDEYATGETIRIRRPSQHILNRSADDNAIQPPSRRSCEIEPCAAPVHGGNRASQPTNDNPESSRPQHGKKYDFIKAFEKKLNVVGVLALGSAGLHNLTRFLGFCALTWASVVLLGGLVSFLQKRDFYLVSSLLLLEASRFVAAVFFSNLVTRRLVAFSANPFQRPSNDWKSKSLLIFLRIIAPAGQLLFVSPSIAFPVLALGSVHYQTGKSPLKYNSTTVDDSLYIFYYLVLTNACIATVAVLYSLLVSLALLYWSQDESLQRYYDEVVWRGGDKGLLSANHFDFLVFAFKLQAEEYSRRVPPKLVEHKYRDLIKYLLNEPKGIETACICLDSDNSHLQQAAANIVGLWSNMTEGKKLPFQTQLLSKLADKVNLGETGWAAAVSFQSLGGLDPYGKKAMLKVKNQKGKKLVDVLMDEIDPANSRRSMVCVRAMLPILEMLRSGTEEDPAQISDLKNKLRQIMSGTEGFLVRERITSGFALHRLNDLTEKDKTRLREMKAGNREYILQEEKVYLEEMLDQEGCLETMPYCKHITVKQAYDEKETLPRSRVCLCFTVGVVMLSLIVAAITLLCTFAVPYWDHSINASVPLCCNASAC